ncbi:formate hydrogenlyase regulator HycA [Enterobacter hormaechei]|nr:formate hydrogenlyase regulator HycA [Enterobacter hormaechei]
MTIWEISEKADYIAQRHQQLQDQWHLYCNSLIQGITLSKARLHHAMSCAAQGDMRFVLFGHFTIFVTLAESFNSHTIEYYVETKEGEKQCIAKAQLMADGMVDGHVSNRDRQQVPEHYLEKIAPVYNGLYAAVEHDQPINLKQLIDGKSSANVA